MVWVGADMPITYEPIASTTLSSNSTSGVTFSSIPSSFTDLVLVVHSTDASFGGMTIQVNGESTGTNYSSTLLFGDGASAQSARFSNQSGMNLGLSDTAMSANVFHFFGYANTNVFKTVLATAAAPAKQVRRAVGLWRSTAAITSITVFNTLQSGSVLSLYGIKAAV